jgi:hypothetical protein
MDLPLTSALSEAFEYAALTRVRANRHAYYWPLYDFHGEGLPV